MDDLAALERREDARHLALLDRHGKRDVRDLAIDDEATDFPTATSMIAGSSALQAVDGDDTTAWRGAPGEPSWTWTLPFRRVVHLGLVRALFGDSSTRGVPGEYRWEFQPPVNGKCETWGLWNVLPGGRHDDRDGNVFLYGPKDAHAQRQVLFTDADACGLRLVVTGMDGNVGPVVREVRLLESAKSLTRSEHVRVEQSGTGTPAVRGSTLDGAVDRTYEKLWSGRAGAKKWALTIHLAETAVVDRLSLRLGYDAATVPLEGKPGRRYSASYLPTRYRIATSHDDDPAHLVPLREGDSPVDDNGNPLPVRRRLVRFDTPRPVKMIRISIDEATDANGVVDPSSSAPVIREVGVFGADDVRPVVEEPLFLSVDANPAGLTDALKGGEAYADGLFARDAYHRLRRIVLGFDADTRWPADASRKRDLGTGRFLEVIEGDDPTLTRELLTAMSPPPIVMLSGSFDWEFDRTTAPSPVRRGHWSWDPIANADDPDRGMGQLRSAVHDRVAPFVGFCGGAQILALLEATRGNETDDEEEKIVDAVLARIENRPIRGLVTRKNPYERGWWSDGPEMDAKRPLVHFDPTDPLFDGPLAPHRRATTRELPMSHGDMIRASAFGTILPAFKLVADSAFCRPWVDPTGVEPSWPSTDGACVRVPQAFRSIDDGYPIVGFQFHPEQRDFPRLAPGDGDDAKGDALAVFANAIDLAIDAYMRLYWPDA